MTTETQTTPYIWNVDKDGCYTILTDAAMVEMCYSPADGISVIYNPNDGDPGETIAFDGSVVQAAKHVTGGKIKHLPELLPGLAKMFKDQKPRGSEVVIQALDTLITKLEKQVLKAA